MDQHINSVLKALPLDKIQHFLEAKRHELAPVIEPIWKQLVHYGGPLAEKADLYFAEHRPSQLIAMTLVAGFVGLKLLTGAARMAFRNIFFALILALGAWLYTLVQ
jgi:hypothetical protein